MRRITISLILICVTFYLAGCFVDQEIVNKKELIDNEFCGAWESILIEDIGEDFTVMNNVFNGEDIKGYTQCIYTYGIEKDPIIGWNWDWPKSSTLSAYPGVLSGYKPWDGAPDNETGFPVTVSNSNISLSFDVDIEAAGSYNVAADIWCGNNNPPTINGITHEVMVWLKNENLVPFGEFVETVTIGNREYELWISDDHYDITENSDHRWKYFAFVDKSEQLQGPLELKGFFDYLVQNNHMEDSIYINSVEFGTQVATGKGVVEVYRYDISL
ncbi:MAG: hypothetical protein JXK07_14195 [Spirochaetes bacterium]|nr:hypothetical protein [Spirochaetota bacterium]MBN2770147.1 hypothetical protein [Spirochaetota bacterium]